MGAHECFGGPPPPSCRYCGGLLHLGVFETTLFIILFCTCSSQCVLLLERTPPILEYNYGIRAFGDR